MNISEWCKLKREYSGLSEEEFAVKAWNLQHKQVREAIMQQEQERFEKAAEREIERQIDKNLDKVIERALLNGKSSMDITINL